MTRLLAEATRLHDVTVGKFDQFKRQLAEGKLDGELLEVLLKRQDLVNGMINWVREQLVPPVVGGRIFDGADLVGWCGEPWDQLDNMMRWNAERGWGFAESDFPSPPEKFYAINQHDVLVLVAYLPDKVEHGMLVPGYVRTFNEYCQIIKAEQPDAGLHKSDVAVDSFRLLAGTEQRHEPGIRWMVVNLQANPDTSPARIRSADSANAELLAVFAQMPVYVRAQNWFNPRKRLWMAGYQVTKSWTNLGVWTAVPNMFCMKMFDDDQFSIHEDGEDDHSRDTFAPTVRHT